MQCDDTEACWDQALLSLPADMQDVFFTSTFCALHAGYGQGSLSLSVLREANQMLLIGGIKTPISLPWTDSDSLYDLQTCLGYGGPVGSLAAVDASFLTRSWQVWRETQQQKQVVAAYFRLHPLIHNERWLPPDATVQMDRQTVLVDLRPGLESVWGAATPQFRNMVRKAQRESLPVVEGTTKLWHDFACLYESSMHRLDAGQAFRLGLEFFLRLRSLAGVTLLAIVKDQELLAGAVFMEGPRWLHYHFAARQPDKGNHLASYLLYKAMEMGIHQHKEGLFLCGAISRSIEDPLLTFKRRTGGCLVPGYIARVVVDPVRFEQLIVEWRRVSGREPAYLLGYREPVATSP